MYQGTYVKKRRKSRTRMNRATVLLMAILMLIGVAAGSTVAYLITETDNVANTFTYGQVSCDIGETFNGTKKENVYVTNTGNVNAYIRAAVVVNWLDSEGNIVPSVPTEYSYNLTITTLKEDPNSNWVEKGKYYYYTLPVAVGGSTEGSLLTCEVKYPEGVKTPEYTLSVEILATAVQSVPEAAVKTAWGEGFSIKPDGSLNVPQG